MFDGNWQSVVSATRTYLGERPAVAGMLCLMIVAAFDPFGELVDLMLLGEAEADLLLLDLELDAVVALVLPFYYTILTLIVLTLLGRGVAYWSCRVPQFLHRAVSLRPPVALKVPIR